MTQHMELIDLGAEDEQDDDVVGYIQLMPPYHRKLGWEIMEIRDGETTVGRDEDQDITIADPTVSARHAAIDVVDLPGRGSGKCITVKDMRSTNGTFMVNASTGENTRLAPRKATVLPEDGCQICFGAVFCKLALGPAPDPSTPRDQVDESAEVGIYDADTEPSDSILHDDGGKAAASGAGLEGDKEAGTDPLAPVEEEGAPATEGVRVESAGAAGADAGQQGQLDEGGVDQGTDDDEVETLQDVVGDIEESKDNVEDEMAPPEGAVGGRMHERGSGGVPFGGSGVADNPEGGRAVGEDGGFYEPPTQAIAMELDETLEDTDEDKPLVNESGELPGHNRAKSTPASAVEGGASAAGGASVDATSRANRTESPDDGEDTADEVETARLFEEDDEMDEAITDAREPVHPRDQEVALASTFAPLTPRQEAQNATSNNEVFSPGGVSEASTQRQEMPEKGLGHGEAGGQEQTGESVKHAADSGDAVRVSVEEKEAAVGGQMDKAAEMSDDEDDLSDASEALIPAQDIEHLEDDYLADIVAQENKKRAEEVGSREARGGDIDANGGGGAVAPDEVADDSGSETDATEVDTDDGPTGDVPGRNVAGERVSSVRPDDAGAGVIRDTSGEAAPRQEPGSPEEIRTPGGSVLRRATTEDTMQAMAMEQHRTQAARSVAAAAREGALAIECESNGKQLANEADGNYEDEVETQAVPMDEEEAISETGAIGTEIVEETGYSDVLGDDAMASLTGNWNAEKPIATSKGLGSSAVGPRSSSDDAASAMATDGDDSSRFADLVPARGTEGIKTESENSGASLGAEKNEVPVQTRDEGFDELEGGKQLEESKEQGEGQNDDHIGAKKGEEDPEAGKRLEEVDKEVRRGAQAPLPPAVPRTSRRHRKKPKAFDEINGDSTATTKPVPEKRGKGMGNGDIPQPEIASSEAGDATPRQGRTRSTRRGATPQPSEKLDKVLTTPTAASRRGPTESVIKTRSRKGTPDGSKSEQEQKPLDRMTKGSSKRRRGEVSSGTPKSSAPMDEPETPASMGSAIIRRRRTAAESCKKDSDSHGGECAGSKVGGLRGCVRRGLQESVGGKTGDSGTGGEVKGKGKGKMKAGRKRAAECDDGEPGRDSESLEGAGAEMEGSKDGFGFTGKGEADGGEDETPSMPLPPPVSGRRGRTGGARTTDASSRVASASSRRGKGRAILVDEKGASPPSPRVSGRSKDRALSNATSSTVGAESEASASVKVCFTNVKPTSKERSCIKKLGISEYDRQKALSFVSDDTLVMEVEDVLKATHLVAGGRGVPLKRTPKLLVGIGRCHFVVDVEWLYQSAKEGRVLDGVEYILCDSEAEKKWRFNMRTSLCRRPDTGLLAGLSVYVDPVVAGTKGMGCPPLDEMKMVVASAGGSWMSQLPKRGGSDPQSLLVITHPEALAASGKRGAKSSQVATAGRALKAFLPEMLFLCILRQRMSWPDELAVETGQGVEAGAVAQTAVKPAKRRRT